MRLYCRQGTALVPVREPVKTDAGRYQVTVAHDNGLGFAAGEVLTVSPGDLVQVEYNGRGARVVPAAL